MIEKYTLENGVRVIIEKIPTVRSVALGVWIGTGSKFESIEWNGISHFIEHMLFKGTATRSAKQIAEAFDQIGGHVNAFTSKEYTCYYARVLDEHAAVALDILADMYFNSVFDEQELQKEKNVVIEEIRMYDDTPDDLVHDIVAKACYETHPLGYSILGTEEVLNRLTRNDIHRYIEARYTPEQTVIAVAGNVSDKLLSEISRYFSGYKRVTKELTPDVKPDFTAGAICKQKDTEQAHLCLSFPGYEVGHKDIYSLILMNNVLGGSMSSRLFQEVREERGLAYSVYSYHSAFKNAGTFTLYTGTATKQLEEVYNVMIHTVAELRDKGITAEELKKGKEQLKGSLMLSLESTNSRMSRLGKNELLLKRHIELDEMIQRVENVTLENVKKVAEDIFSQPMAMALVSPLEAIPDYMRSDIFVRC
ncbi:MULTISPECIES: M16 family metallopeptidase [Aneurinibacillus]|uniref:Insulinase family protein n=1 Tax=Aneurinibacillus thermoaerophilus TaxID=143495 RepID=A0A1G7WGK9_ANETH|nr:MULTISPECIES: pitrilysin family protein [Aneurinibacillus]AMA72715.1 zinc protease [Aneurinibacillus sp. XH2]MED0674562.1 pitrilysin family protein [Aneurinibacillus thermoaerophilus]MED0677931.1 pitrilysin family protein [Aneurinibacillus thermoaerophilus]MED0737006.1 pitrilysin family protein [Aneurinibacillus thermoaerophilus]MED0756847.1 pitrilysin family protein [Aneurinibacillus thermoaerophilus]